MRLKNYDLLQDIRRAGMKPSHVVIYLYPVKILPVSAGFIDTDLCTRDEESELSEYDMDALNGLHVCLVGKRKDDRLRRACKTAAMVAETLCVTSPEHDGVSIWDGSAWIF